MQRTSGHVFRVERNRGPVWYAKYRLPSGRQVQRMLGPAWGARGRPPAGHFTKRLAEDWLRETLDGACRGTTAGMVEAKGNKKAPLCGAFSIAGAGFEPATFGL